MRILPPDSPGGNMVALFSPDELSSVPDESLIGPLRTTRRTPASTGFRGVYYKMHNHDGVPVYVAKIKLGGSFCEGRSRGGGRPLGYSTQPHVCAAMVAMAYRAMYGDDWVRVLRARKLCPWQVRYSEARRGWVAAAWVRGRRQEVVRLTRVLGQWVPGDRLAVFASEADARRGLRSFLARLYGPEWRALLWRDNLKRAPGGADARPRAA